MIRHCLPFVFLVLSACSSAEPANAGSGTAGTGGQPGQAGASFAGATSAGAMGGAVGGAGTAVGGAGGVGAGGGGASSVIGSSGSSAKGGASFGGAAGVDGGAQSSGGEGGVGGSSEVPADFFVRYEAESPLNSRTYPVETVTTEGDPACPADGVTEGATCASGGKVVAQILGRSPCTPPASTTSYDQCQNKGGGVQFNAVTVPADGTYDVTWWYHCGPDKPGHADVYGDTKCGGLDYGTGAGSGCRPHLIDVNGAPMSASVDGKAALYYQFPCYAAPWSTLHGATTALPLKAGANTIYIHAPGATTLDAVDLDALDVRAKGHGTAPAPLWPKLVTPVLTGN